jgi:hypothetical protein
MSPRSFYLRDQATKCEWHANIRDDETEVALRKLVARYVAEAEDIESEESGGQHALAQMKEAPTEAALLRLNALSLGMEANMDAAFSFLISVGIIAFGIWIVAATPLAWALMGLLTVIVGSISLCQATRDFRIA